MSKQLNYIRMVVILLGLLIHGNQSAMAYTVDGNLNDWGIDLYAANYQGYLNNHLPGGLNVNYVTGDYVGPGGYVGPGYGGQIYDLEAIYFDNDHDYGYIAIITGFPQSGTAVHGPGDIAMDILPCGEYNYEYGIDLETGNLIHMPDWDDVSLYSQSNPWTIGSGNVVDNCDVVYSSLAVNDHYVIEASFLLADLGLSMDDVFNIHWTMECGNDVLDLQADISAAPEPATFILLGSGLMGIRWLRRKNGEPGIRRGTGLE